VAMERATVPHSGSVFRRQAVDVVGALRLPAPGHVLRHDRRIAGMCLLMCAQQARIEIVSTPRRVAITIETFAATVEIGDVIGPAQAQRRPTARASKTVLAFQVIEPFPAKMFDLHAIDGNDICRLLIRSKAGDECARMTSEILSAIMMTAALMCAANHVGPMTDGVYDTEPLHTAH